MEAPFRGCRAEPIEGCISTSTTDPTSGAGAVRAGLAAPASMAGKVLFLVEAPARARLAALCAAVVFLVSIGAITNDRV